MVHTSQKYVLVGLMVMMVVGVVGANEAFAQEDTQEKNTNEQVIIHKHEYSIAPESQGVIIGIAFFAMLAIVGSVAFRYGFSFSMK